MTKYKNNIGKGFLDQKYSGLACIVQQPNGSYLLITHEISAIHMNSYIYYYQNQNLQYVGDFIRDKYFVTKSEYPSTTETGLETVL